MIETRPLGPDDHDAWRRLWTAYLAFYEATVPEAVYRSTWVRLMGDDPRDVCGILAVADGQPVGLAQYLVHRHGWKVGDVCYLQDLYADPHARGRGVGRALIEAVYAAADRLGAEDVYWTTAHDNPARVLYDRVGRRTQFVKYQRA